MTETQLLARPLTRRNLDWPDCSSSPQQKIAASHWWKASRSGFDGTPIVKAVKSEPRGAQVRSRGRTTFTDYYEDRVRVRGETGSTDERHLGELVSGSDAGFETATSADPFTLSDWHHYLRTVKAIHRPLQEQRQEQEEEQDRQRLWDRLDTSFAHEDLDPDRDHPAERTLGQALFNPWARCWLVEFCADEGHPELAASLLLCLCRLSALYLVEWEKQLITRALACDDMEIRDAAVQLAAAWGGDHLQGLLQSHQDSEGWLQDYIGSVLEDWSI